MADTGVVLSGRAAWCAIAAKQPVIDDELLLEMLSPDDGQTFAIYDRNAMGSNVWRCITATFRAATNNFELRKLNGELVHEPKEGVVHGMTASEDDVDNALTGAAEWGCSYRAPSGAATEGGDWFEENPGVEELPAGEVQIGEQAEPPGGAGAGGSAAGDGDDSRTEDEEAGEEIEEEKEENSPGGGADPSAPAADRLPEWLAHGERVSIVRQGLRFGALVHSGGAGGLQDTDYLFAMDDGGFVQRSTDELLPLLDSKMVGPRVDDAGEIAGTPADAAVAFTMTPGHGALKPFVAGVLIGQAARVMGCELSFKSHVLCLMSFEAREVGRRASRGSAATPLSRSGYATFWYGDKVAEVEPCGADGQPVHAAVVRVVMAQGGKAKADTSGRKYLVLREVGVPSPCFFVGGWADWKRIPQDEIKGWGGHDPDQHDAPAATISKDEMAKIEEVREQTSAPCPVLVMQCSCNNSLTSAC